MNFSNTLERYTKALPPSMGESVNEVLNVFRDKSRLESGLAVVEAVLTMSSKGGQIRYRWLDDGLNVVVANMGVFRPDGLVSTRMASEAEYSELEEGLACGAVQITCRHRISGQNSVLHQATGKSMPLDKPESIERPKMNA